ncbi:porin family protein [Runella slithyformis]|uniref:Secreted protein n=1 Tax=Runella slithyformis (strain ATCC 29530 / DSM 19594 / LMG 11500 / NCIMB 11436 / LSU 4) TaxID=761193 RepID=A0A7U3ZHZ3_RUNSL|nr:porin family protein [Runella slithyformis]AEI47581.1 secreted protein [Runella slithyformis DSM 19594]
MKKAFFALAFLGALQATAQFNRKLVFIGIKGGANFSQLQTTEFKISKPGASVQDFFQTNSTNRTGYVVGAYARIGRKVFIQPEVLLSSKGGTFEILKNGSTTPVNVNVKFSQIDIPVLLGLKVGPLRLNAGPMASLNIAQGSQLGDALKAYTTQNVNKTIEQATFGFQAGVGLDIRSFNLDLRYESGLSNISQLSLQNNAQFNSKVSLWQLTAGFVLF